MRFNADRLAVLAGFREEGKSSMLNEASNRSMHDDPSLKGDGEHRFGKNQLAEDSQTDDMEEDDHMEEDEHMKEDDHMEVEGDYMEEDSDDMYEDEDVLDEVQGLFDDDGDEVVEIDEAMLKKEILRMRAERRQTVAENKVRAAIRREINDMFGSKVYSDSSWVYGDNKPSHSKAGQVAVGALGIGFKK